MKIIISFVFTLDTIINITYCISTKITNIQLPNKTLSTHLNPKKT